jgi:hypothetical protein
MTRHLALGTALAAVVMFTPVMTSIVQGQGKSDITLQAGDERQICTGVKATVTPAPKYGDLRTFGDPNGAAAIQIFYKAKDTTSAVSETLTCTVGAQMDAVNITVRPQGFSPQAYPEAFKALFLLFVLAILLESALAILFNWRPFVETFNSRAVKPVISLLLSLIVVYKFGIDLVTTLAKLINPSVPAMDDTGKILTAMMIAGGSAGVNNLMVGLGFRQQRTPETVTPKPPANKGWISVSIIRTDQIKGPVTVAIGTVTGDKVPVVAALSHSTTPGRRFFFRDRGRFPGSGGYAVAKDTVVKVTATAEKADGSTPNMVKSWGPEPIADGAIIDLTFTMSE